MSPKCLVFLPSSFSTMITAPLPPLIYDHSPFPAFLPPSPLSLFLHVAARRSILKSRFIWPPPPLAQTALHRFLVPQEKGNWHMQPFFFCLFCLSCQSSLASYCASPGSVLLWSLCFVTLQLTRHPLSTIHASPKSVSSGVVP